MLRILYGAVRFVFKTALMATILAFAFIWDCVWMLVCIIASSK